MISRRECRAAISADAEARPHPAPTELRAASARLRDRQPDDVSAPSTSIGFTLVELLVCLAIMGLLLGLVPSLMAGGRSGLELRAAAHEVMTALREARSSAISQGTPAAFRIDVARGDYRTGAGAAHRLPAGIAVSLVAAEEDRRNRTPGTIRFFADGSSTGGGLHLARGDHHLTILVDWLTGRVSLEEDAQ